jgi:hypothetical protein
VTTIDRIEFKPAPPDLNQNDVIEIRLSDLFVDPSVQRPTEPKRVEKIAGELDLDAIGIIDVSTRPRGKFHILDGAHRVAALRKVFDDTIVTPCRVHVGLDRKAEARMFRLLNNTAKPTNIASFLVRVVENKSPAREISNMLARYGWHVEDSQKDGSFRAVMAIEAGWKQDPIATERAVEILTKAWGFSRVVMDARLFTGLVAFISRYGDAIEFTGLVDNLAKSGTPAQMIGLVNSNRENLKWTATRAMAETVLGLYNKGRKTRRLPNWV